MRKIPGLYCRVGEVEGVVGRKRGQDTGWQEKDEERVQWQHL